MKIRKVEKEDLKEGVKILLQMQEVHRKGRKDIFRKTSEKEVEKEFLSLLESNKKGMIVAIDKNNKVRGLSYCRS